MKDLEKIHIVFENCEVGEIEKKDIYNLQGKGITENILLIANACIVGKQAKEISLTLRWDNVKDIVIDEHFKTTLRDALEHKHIVYYVLYFNDGTEMKVSVPWEGDSQYTNPGEKHEKWSNDGKMELLSIIHGADEEEVLQTD